ncbi:MAG: 4Fe-4S dicluster domain-containing protein [Candidatus Hydrogenedentes bacterium]|jgi:formate hydrogenlyase subunit 6/NADH:ubiquinone oxidoreductase subunit I|nr:4Fe-4S dicluster domain-containing protein [Candidatus Hydrogenedentota bacterium]
MKAMAENEVAAFLASLEARYDVRAPFSLPDGTRALGRLEEGPLALAGGAIPRKPTDVFFPQFGDMFTVRPDRVDTAKVPDKPLCVVGLTAEDCGCLEFIDRFYAANYRDEVYFSRRDGAVIVALSGRCGLGGALLKVAGGDCDLELIRDGQKWIVAAYSETGRAIEAAIQCEEQDASLSELQRESDATVTEGLDTLDRATALLEAGAVPDRFWEDIAQRCIACTACNLACPTCTCFEVCDADRGTAIERSRLWDSCQLDGFMREASTHNPLGTEALRTRRRIHHKLVADPRRWGHVTCYVCGRCDDVCPTGIGMKSVTKEIVDRYGH